MKKEKYPPRGLYSFEMENLLLYISKVLMSVEYLQVTVLLPFKSENPLINLVQEL
jgi:hypothetical protein